MVTSPSEKLSNGTKKTNQPTNQPTKQTNKQTNKQNLTKPPPQDLENKGLCQALAHLCRAGETCATHAAK